MNHFLANRSVSLLPKRSVHINWGPKMSREAFLQIQSAKLPNSVHCKAPADLTAEMLEWRKGLKECLSQQSCETVIFMLDNMYQCLPFERHEDFRDYFEIGMAAENEEDMEWMISAVQRLVCWFLNQRESDDAVSNSFLIDLLRYCAEGQDFKHRELGLFLTMLSRGEDEVDLIEMPEDWEYAFQDLITANWRNGSLEEVYQRRLCCFGQALLEHPEFLPALAQRLSEEKEQLFDEGYFEDFEINVCIPLLLLAQGVPSDQVLDYWPAFGGAGGW